MKILGKCNYLNRNHFTIEEVASTLSEQVQTKLALGNNQIMLMVCGHRDENIKNIEQNFAVKLVVRGDEVNMFGLQPEIAQVTKVFTQLIKLAKDNVELTPQQVNYVINVVKQGEESKVTDLSQQVVLITTKGKTIKPRTYNQAQYIKAIKNHDLVFGIGPAGTGKTYLAVVMAVAALKSRQVSKIILTRPAVEAGEKLGFLPGDLQEKVDPYLRPLYDGLYDVLGGETTQKYLERGIIEIAPLAYMRGRTLEESFIILDEAQNTTPEQMKMFLTRLGNGSKAVITGDITQVDLPKGHKSGLLDVQRVLQGVEGLSFEYLLDVDVVRHPLVQKIVQAYDRRAQDSK